MRSRLARERRLRARSVDVERLEQFEDPCHCVACAVNVAMPEFPVQAVQSLCDEGTCASFSVGQAAKTFGGCLGDLDAAGQVLPVENWSRCNASLRQVSPQHLVSIGERRDPCCVGLAEIVEGSLDQIIRPTQCGNHSADLDRLASVVGANADQYLMMPRALRSITPHEGRIDTEIDRGRCLMIAWVETAQISFKERRRAQYLAAGGAPGAPDSERKKDHRQGARPSQNS